MTSNKTTDAKLLAHKAIIIYPGEVQVQNKTPISTLLGSCVAICLYDPHLRLAGMNHYMLPHFRDREKNLHEGVYSGMASMDKLINALLQRGAHKSRLIAKGFGGGCLHGSKVGEKNIAFAKEWLGAEHIPIQATDWGGHWARKIIFDPQTGDVFCQRINRELALTSKLEKAEATYQEKLRADLVRPKVDYW